MKKLKNYVKFHPKKKIQMILDVNDIYELNPKL